MLHLDSEAPDVSVSCYNPFITDSLDIEDRLFSVELGHHERVQDKDQEHDNTLAPNDGTKEDSSVSATSSNIYETLEDTSSRLYQLADDGFFGIVEGASDLAGGIFEQQNVFSSTGDQSHNIKLSVNDMIEASAVVEI